jgi:signal transduction histidine kinase/ActR/RegA family two-component response regulator
MSDEPSALRDVRDALTGITRRLDELAARVAGLTPAAARAPIGEPLDEPARRQLAEIESLLAVGPGLGRDAALLLAVDRVIHRAAADCAALFLPTADGDLEAAVERGLGPGVPRLALGEGIVGRAFLGGETIVGTPAHQVRDWLLGEHGLEQALAVPVRLPDQPSLGVLFAGRRRPTAFDAAALETLILLADRVALVLGGAGGAGAASAPAAFTTDLDLDRTTAAVARTLALRLGVAHLAVLLLADDGLRVGAGVGVAADAAAPTPEAEPLATVLRTGDPWIGMPPADEALADFLGAPPRLVAPLLAGGRPVGLVVAGSPAPVTPAAIAAWLEPAAVAIRNARLHAETVAALRQAREMEAGPAALASPVRDLGELLAVLLARIGLVRERVADPGLAADLAVAEEAAWRAVETMRAAVGFGPGRRGESLAPLDVGALVRSVVEAARRRWASRGAVAPAVEVDLEPLPPVRGHADELRDALDHLLENAADAVASGGAVTVRGRWDGGRRVELLVQDTGSGMDEAVRQRALEPFFSTKGAGRLGLGLPVVQAILTRHGGTLELRSAPGQGTTVRLLVPTATGVRSGPAPAGGSTARVLVIEDEPAVREAVVGLLRQRGYLALAAADGAEGLAMIEREAVDVVFTDLAVAAVSGFDVARAVKRLRPGTPVVLITGWPGRLDREEVAASGIDRVIEKPVGAAEVFAALESALGARREKPA